LASTGDEGREPGAGQRNASGGGCTQPPFRDYQHDPSARYRSVGPDGHHRRHLGQRWRNQAAKQLCQEDLAGNPYAAQIAPYCARDVARDAIKRTHSANLVAYDKAQGRDAYFEKVATR
jgi:hypothetical protein